MKSYPASVRKVVKSYMQRVPMVHEHCDRCLAGRRWHGNALLMVIDAAFDSIGLNYFQSVVPRVELFRQRYVATGKIVTFEDLAGVDDKKLKAVWKNARSWSVAREIAAYLAKLKKKYRLDDSAALIRWAMAAPLKRWESDPIGRINGVGINTYQYLRMMGGVDTVMPDKIVKRVFFEMLDRAGIKPPQSDLEFISFIEEFAPAVGYRPIELCWMTWLVQSEAGLSRTEKYASLLPKI